MIRATNRHAPHHCEGPAWKFHMSILHTVHMKKKIYIYNMFLGNCKIKTQPVHTCHTKSLCNLSPAIWSKLHKWNVDPWYRHLQSTYVGRIWFLSPKTMFFNTWWKENGTYTSSGLGTRWSNFMFAILRNQSRRMLFWCFPSAPALNSFATGPFISCPWNSNS